MDKVIIKNQKYGISLKLDDTAPFGTLLREIQEKFEKSRKFFGRSDLTLTFEGRKLTPEQENAVIGVIEQSSDIRILCIFVEDEERDSVFVRAANKLEDLQQMEQEAKEALKIVPDVAPMRTFIGNVKAGEIRKCKDNIIIYGDIEEGAALISERSVIVLGSVLGVVHAGDGAGGKHFVYALSFKPRKMLIDGVRFEDTAPKRKLFEKPKPLSGIAYLSGSSVRITAKPEEIQEVMRGMADLNLTTKESGI
ncbi:MAG: septum site-determining protein MinC [Firmicutes bacterium]|nr:septum site-determining protein MinC [Bacillota bacterium]